jgi:hypothetical protein
VKRFVATVILTSGRREGPRSGIADQAERTEAWSGWDTGAGAKCRPGVGVGQGSATWEGEPKWDRGPEPSQCRRFDSVHPTGQNSKRCPHVEGHALRLSARHAKFRRDGYRNVCDADVRHMLASGSEPRIPRRPSRPRAARRRGRRSSRCDQSVRWAAHASCVAWTSDARRPASIARSRRNWA